MKSKSVIFVLLIVLSIIIGVAGGFFISKMICEQRISKLESELAEYKNNANNFALTLCEYSLTRFKNPIVIEWNHGTHTRHAPLCSYFTCRQISDLPNPSADTVSFASPAS